MEHKLTDKIAAAYLGCNVKGSDKSGILVGVASEIDLSFLESLTNYKIILKPLNEITDEQINDLWVVCNFNSAYPISKRRNDIIGMIEYEDCIEGFTPRDIINIVDTVRSKGYDCGYGNIPSLIDAGIAISSLTLK